MVVSTYDRLKIELHDIVHVCLFCMQCKKEHCICAIGARPEANSSDSKAR